MVFQVTCRKRINDFSFWPFDWHAFHPPPTNEKTVVYCFLGLLFDHVWIWMLHASTHGRLHRGFRKGFRLAPPHWRWSPALAGKEYASGPQETCEFKEWKRVMVWWATLGRWGRSHFGSFPRSNLLAFSEEGVSALMGGTCYGTTVRFLIQVGMKSKTSLTSLTS